MRNASWSPAMVPYGADQTIYLVVDRLHAGGAIYRDAEFERTDLETTIGDLMSGQFNDPVRVIVFNTLEHWARDVSGEIAAEMQTRCDIDGEPIPDYIVDFVERNAACGRPFGAPVSAQGRRQRYSSPRLR